MSKTPTRLPPDALIKMINKHFGANTLVRATDAVGLVRPRISTGSFALDLQLNGGYPEGGITLLEGESGASKSTLLLKMARNFLDKHPNGVFILVNAEGTNDCPYLELLGVDVERTYFLQPDSGEQAWDAAVMVAEHAEKAFIGVDSLDACVPMCELEGDVGDAKYAPAAKMNNKGFRKLISAMKTDITSEDQRITPVFITQLREAIGVMFGDTKISVGGRGKKFAATTIIRLARQKILRTEGEKLVDKKSYGLLVDATIIKNKGWGEGEKVTFTYYKENHEGFRRGDIDNVTELIPYMFLYKIVDKKGAWIEVGGQTYQGEDAFAAQLRQNPQLLEWATTEVYKSHARRYEKRPDPTPTKTPAKPLLKITRSKA